MNFKIVMVCGAVTLACIGAYSPAALAAAAEHGGPGIVRLRLSCRRHAAAGQTAERRRATIEDITWDMLLPEGWSVEKVMESLNLNALDDNDPKAREAMKKIREMWDKAPANPKLDNRRVSIAGFVVPLDGEREKTREFLLVPYFGACIHAPAPPANQVIHVKVARPRTQSSFRRQP